MEFTKRELAEALRKALDEKMRDDDISMWELLSKVIWAKLMLELSDQMGKFGGTIHSLSAQYGGGEEEGKNVE